MKGDIRIKKSGKSILLSLLALMLLAGCSAFTPPPPMVQTGMDEYLSGPDSGAPGAEEAGPALPADLPPLGLLEPQVAVEEKLPYENMLFSLSARNTPIREVLLGLAKEAGMNLIIEKGVDPSEPASAEMQDLPLKTALETLLSSYDYFYKIEGNIMRVKAVDTRVFRFNYPLFVNAPSSSVGGDMLGSTEATDISGQFTLDATVEDDSLDIWKQIEEALVPEGEGGKGGILSSLGHAQINKMSGIILITDRKRNLESVEEFLKKIEQSLRRQVVIEAKILEVTLNESHRYGINWNAVARSNSGNTTVTLSPANALAGTGPLQMFQFTTQSRITTSTGLPTFSLTNTFMDLLSAQGAVNVLSSPRLNVMNNQSALISVGTTLPYLDWQVNTSQDPTTGNAITTIVPRVETAQEGISLGVTAQIDEDDVTTLHITPIITDSNATQAFTYNGNTWSVPIIDMRATDTTVRVKSGDTIVIGGLIKENLTEDKDQITGLGNLPIIGKLLFTGETRTKQKQELVILLTPTVVSR